MTSHFHRIRVRLGLVAGAALAVSTLLMVAGPASAAPGRNIEAQLRPVAGGPDGGFGLVKFRQPKDSDIVIDLDVWVRDLAPDHGYYLQRATDGSPNDDCTGTNWLTLGQGTVPQVITTDGMGNSRADLFRGLPAALLGTPFDIHFRVIDAVTSTVVLESACYQFTVSQ